MPFVQIKLIEGVFSSEQKNQMLEKVTNAMLSVEGENLREVTTVVIDEVKSGDWAVGGRRFEADQVKAIAEGKSKKVA